jgi:hypothetical protein
LYGGYFVQNLHLQIDGGLHGHDYCLHHYHHHARHHGQTHVIPQMNLLILREEVLYGERNLPQLRLQ